jgi:hypothetical protein
MFLEWVDARQRTQLRLPAAPGVLNFLPAAPIPGFACGMLLYRTKISGPSSSHDTFHCLESPPRRLSGMATSTFSTREFGVAATLLLSGSRLAPPIILPKHQWRVALGDT